MTQQPAVKDESKLPSLGDITYDIEQAGKRDYLNKILNNPPKKEWVKEHPFAKGVKYIQIDKIEYLLRTIFQRTRTEVIDFKVIANAISVHVRLHYVDPVTNEWDFQDGLGAVAIQVEKGAAATDFSMVRSDAIMKNLPAAESYAVKDAAEKLGKLFGSDINRKDEITFSGVYSNYWETVAKRRSENGKQLNPATP